ncbi:MAG: DeoR/GlpR family DNA-binding transcription regulator [Pyrinomonadaceae bacterium]|nr:DeoR/GlpR family DNA-binding transcription regulator [Pyrinomonadaceae bacterium]
MLKSERSKEILQQLLRDGEVTVSELAKHFKTGPTTVRRALTDLERAGLLRRTHGGAIQVEPMFYEPFRYLPSFVGHEQFHAAEKRRIGLAAAEIVKDGETIALGAGSTTTQVGRSLRHRKGITVVTNALNIAMELSHRTNLKIIVTGGSMSGDSFALTGSPGIAAVGDRFYDKAFIGAAGIHPDHGLTTNCPDESPVHQAMIRQSRQRIVVADHSKIGNVGKALIARITDLDLIITDESASQKLSEFSAEVLRV